MGRFHFLPVLALSLLAACGAPTTALVRGRVVDAEDRPVPGAEISLSSFPAMPLDENRDRLVADANGEFDGVLPLRSRGGANVLALVNDGRGGVAHMNRRREPITIVVHPLSRVKGRVSTEKLPAPIREWMASNSEGFRRIPMITVLRHRRPAPGSEAPARSEVVSIGKYTDGDFEFLLPAGEYAVNIWAFHQPINRDFQVTEGGGDVDLGVMEARPFPEQELFGAPAPPLHLADARGVAKDFDLSAWRGKWVLLFFWDHRMKANSHFLPSLVRFAEERPELREKYEVLAIHHSDDVLTVNELDRARWRDEGAKPEPFSIPVAVDNAEKTFLAYRIERGRPRQHPHWFLINPEGRVEFCPGVFGPVQMLQSKLEPAERK